MTQPRATIPTPSVVDADTARRARSGPPAGRALPIPLDVRERDRRQGLQRPANREASQAVRRRRLRRPCRNARVRSLWLNA